jgi:hypothetical protein
MLRLKEETPWEGRINGKPAYRLVNPFNEHHYWRHSKAQIIAFIVLMGVHALFASGYVLNYR